MTTFPLSEKNPPCPYQPPCGRQCDWTCAKLLYRSLWAPLDTCREALATFQTLHVPHLPKAANEGRWRNPNEYRSRQQLKKTYEQIYSVQICENFLPEVLSWNP